MAWRGAAWRGEARLGSGVPEMGHCSFFVLYLVQFSSFVLYLVQFLEFFGFFLGIFHFVDDSLVVSVESEYWV